MDRYAASRSYAVPCALTSMIRASLLARWLLMHGLQDGIDHILEEQELVRQDKDMRTRMLSVVTNMRDNAVFEQYFARTHNSLTDVQASPGTEDRR